MSNNRRRRPPGSQAQARAAVGANGQFTFTHKGSSYILPPASDAAGKFKAGEMIDAVMGDSELAELRLGVAMLLAVGADQKTMDALRDMDLKKFGETVGKWMRTTGVEPGE